MAKSGVLTQWINVPQHTGTHCDAPRHVMEYEFDGRRARYTHEMPIDAYTGDAVCLKIEVEPWGLIGPKDLEAACAKAGVNPVNLAGMVLVLDTGMHKYYDDSKAYYHYACGTGVEAGRWLVKHKVKCVAMDGQALGPPPSYCHGPQRRHATEPAWTFRPDPRRRIQAAIRRKSLRRIRQV